ncbi:MAG TPA: RagB/SusD family nutrient uptake outer membrane protein [Cyclobacteriaceae bacterium]|nr:RagB/SusD family nutrient uptake outer membrane protein [Cyclobacteriaceae bacterium]
MNAVRKRSDASVTLAPADNAALLTAIMTERNIELLGEGFRSNDFMRQLQTIPGKGTVGSVPASASIYIWPIPIQELNANKLMQPNN